LNTTIGVPLYFYNNVFYFDSPYIFDARGASVFVNNFFRVRKSVFRNVYVTPEFRYNAIWNTEKQSFMDSTNKVMYHQFNSIVFALEPGITDTRLQKYSPLINSGDPSILDVDGSRSDIGSYGGPGGSSYEYEDLAPLKPEGVILENSTYLREIKLKWNRNYESDFEGYKIYSDSVSNFTADESKEIGKTADTSVVIPRIRRGKAYYQVKSMDSQKNLSSASKEVGIVITSVEEEGKDGESPPEMDSYPNPFNENTVISYRINRNAFVTLKVYDTLGNEIATLVNETKPAGSYSVNFNASNLPSGVYLYELRAGPSTGSGTVRLVKKMSLIK